LVLGEGDVDLLELYFTCDKEASSFCEYLFKYHKHIELHWKTNEEWGNQLQFNQTLLNDDKTIEMIGQSMVDVFNTYRLAKTIEHIIKSKYYYKNVDEIDRILELSHWIITGDDHDSIHVRQHRNPHHILKRIFIEHLRQANSFHYDSIVKFRLTPFKDELIHYVGLAIDEFKREEDHQTFVNMLREYIGKQKARFEKIYILQGENFAFYKPNGQQFSKMELRKIMQKEPLYMVGLDIDEWNLAPLVALAPKTIKIYGDDPSEPKTLTIINIFQERVNYKSIRHFPFRYYKKK